MFAIASVFLSAAFLRIYLISRDSVPFAYDMGRDLLWAKDISFYGIPTLIGPAASIWGVYFPPFWFYFLAVPLRLFGGHPLSVVAATAAIIVLTGILAFILTKSILSKFYAAAFSIFILFSSTLINLSTFAFHANMLPIITLGFIYFSFFSAAKNPFYFAVSAFLAGLMFSADPAPAVVFTVTAAVLFLYLKLYKFKHLKKLTAVCFLAYLIPLAPDILFEIRNNFVQSRSLLAYFRGENPSLSGQLAPIERIGNRADAFFDFFKTSFAADNNLLAGFLLVVITFGVANFFKNYKKREDLISLLKINLIVIIASFLVMTFIITVEIKNWYLYGLTVPAAAILALSFYGFKNKKIALVFLAIYLAVNILPFFKNQRTQKSAADPATLSNQLAAVDYIYKDQQDGNFSLYVFTPVVYDYHYQYLFWWRGVVLGRGLPQEFAYLPNQPPYVRNKNLYAKSGQNTQAIYLIIENAPENEFYSKNNWLANFTDYQIIWEKDINNAIKIRKIIRGVK
ncbi:hypothetical protein HYZ70_00385 [Candidatus Curtissbacteria bacterium]|nr:hypothetical protein [Candidatus Curtissbacteria bacterium]